MVDFEVSEEAGERGCLDAAKVERIAAAFVDVGLVSIANVLPLEVCDSLREQMDHDSAHMAAQRMWVRAPGHLQQGLPRIGPCVPREVVANPIIEQLAFAILGPCHISFFNGNSNLPGSSPQILHCDGPWHVRSAEQAAERGEEWPPKPASVSVTFSPSEMSPANGSTEGTRPSPSFPSRASCRGAARS